MNNERVRGKALKAGVSSIIIRHFICFSYVSNHVGLFTSVGVENLEKNKHNWKLRANATFQKKNTIQKHAALTMNEAHSIPSAPYITSRTDTVVTLYQFISYKLLR